MDNNSQSVAVEQTTAAAKKTRRRRKAKRTIAGGFALAIGLSGAGVLASALTPDAQVATAEKDDQALVQEGKDIYDTACITCHGANLQGIEGRGPSLVGIGAGSVYFQVHSGRMPMMSNDAQAERKRPRYTEEQALALAAAAGARVTLVSGPTALPTPLGVDRVDVESADEMEQEVRRFAGPAEADGYRRLRRWLSEVYRTERDRFIDANFDKVDRTLEKYREGEGYQSYEKLTDDDRRVLAAGVVASLLLDHYGVLQAPRAVDLWRTLGALLVLAGTLLVVAPWQSRDAAAKATSQDHSIGESSR